MSAAPELFGTHAEMQSTALDTLGLLRLALEHDGDAMTQMLATFTSELERARLSCALLATSATLLRVAAQSAAIAPEELLAMLVQDVRDDE